MLFGVLTLFRRHLTNCRHRPKGRKHRSCQCPLWVEGTLRAEKVRRSLDMRSWEAGQDLLREWESRGPNTALISVEDAVSRFLEDVAARNLAEATVAKQKVLLSRLTAFAEDVGGKYISQLAGESTLPFNREEFEGILAAIDKYPTKNSFGYDNRARLRAFVLLLRYSGLLIRDGVCLRRDRIVDGKLMVYTQQTGQAVYVPLPPVVEESLAKSGSGELLFWSGHGNPKSAVADWQRSLRRLFDLAGVEDGHAHRFRDTFAVALLQKGVPLETVAILLGNTIKIAEKHYAPWVRSRQVALEDAVRKSWS